MKIIIKLTADKKSKKEVQMSGSVLWNGDTFVGWTSLSNKEKFHGSYWFVDFEVFNPSVKHPEQIIFYRDVEKILNDKVWDTWLDKDKAVLLLADVVIGDYNDPNAMYPKKEVDIFIIQILDENFLENL